MVLACGASTACGVEQRARRLRAARRRRVVGLWLPSAAPGSVGAVLMVPARCGSDLLMRTAPRCVSDQQRSARTFSTELQFLSRKPLGRFGQRAKFLEPSCSALEASLTAGTLHLTKPVLRQQSSLRQLQAETQCFRCSIARQEAACYSPATPPLTCRCKLRPRARSSLEFRHALRVALFPRAEQQQRWRDSW